MGSHNHEMHGRHERGEERLIEDNSPYRVRGISGVGGRMLTIPGSEQKAREQGCSRYYGMSVVGRDERPRSSAWAIGDDRSFVMGPHSQYVDGLFLFKDFVYQTVLDVDSPRVAPLQVAFE